MPILKDKIRTNTSIKNAISEKVESEYIKPTMQEQQTAADVIRIISEQFADELIEKDIDEVQEDIKKAVQEECQKLDLPFEEQKRIEKTVLLTALGNGPIEEYLQDPDVTEIIVQRYDNIVIEKNGKIQGVEASFNNEQHLETIIKRIVQRVGRQINKSVPIVDARLKDGSRVNATIPPASPDGATLTIRKFNQKALSGKDYLNFGSLNRSMLYFLERCVKGKINIFVSGGTGTGKTTLLNMLSSYIPNDELIITIEDTLELKLQQKNIRRMEVRLSNSKEMMNVDQTMLIKAALRQRPDRIVVGETRDGSIVDVISAMSTGHEGSLSTAHANNPRNLCDSRIPTLYAMNDDVNFSEYSVALQLAEALQLIVQISRFPDGSRKISHITCVDGLTKDHKVNLHDVFVYDKKDKCFKYTGYYPKRIVQLIKEKELDFDDSIFPAIEPEGIKEEV